MMRLKYTISWDTPDSNVYYGFGDTEMEFKSRNEIKKMSAMLRKAWDAFDAYRMKYPEEFLVSDVGDC